MNSKAIAMTYKITIRDEMFGSFTGEFDGDTQELAEQAAKEFYSESLDTYMEEIEIVSVTPLN